MGIVACVLLLLLLSGCSGFFNSGLLRSYELTMYVSLGLATGYPADPTYDGSDIAGLSNYGGKNVSFSVVGVDPGVNTDINLQSLVPFNWTGGDQSSSTQYASFTADLASGGTYPGGRYTFTMFIDWDGSGQLDSGDIVFGSYAIYADKDNDETTGSIEVTASEYGGAISYSATDHSITILDPASDQQGLAWRITAMEAGELIVYP